MIRETNSKHAKPCRKSVGTMTNYAVLQSSQYIWLSRIIDQSESSIPEVFHVLISNYVYVSVGLLRRTNQKNIANTNRPLVKMCLHYCSKVWVF